MSLFFVGNMILAQTPAAEIGPEAATGIARFFAPLIPVLGVLAVAFVVTFLMTPVMRWLALKNGIVDWPDAKRKAHAKPVAYLGGVAIFIGWTLGILAYILIFAKDQVYSHTLISILMGAGAIVLTGLIDDIYGIRARVKIAGQLFAAAAIAQQEVGTKLVHLSFELVGLTGMPFGMHYWLGTAVIAMLIVGGCNALNLIDGLDGLASGVTGIASLGMLIIATIFIVSIAVSPEAQAPALVPIVVCLAILGGVLGFLPYNFNPASIFMGDTGSLLLGYLCITVILSFGNCTHGPILVAGGLICFALPILDAVLAMVRRKMQGKSMFAPDAMHIHHMLRRSGLSVKKSVLSMYLLAGVFATLGVATVAFQVLWQVSIAAFALLVLLVMVVGYRTSLRLEARSDSASPPIEAPNGAKPGPSAG